MSLPEKFKRKNEEPWPTVFFLVAFPVRPDGRSGYSEKSKKEQIEYVSRVVATTYEETKASCPPYKFKILSYDFVSFCVSGTSASSEHTPLNAQTEDSEGMLRCEAVEANHPSFASETPAEAERTGDAGPRSSPFPPSESERRSAEEGRRVTGGKVAEEAALFAVRKKLPQLKTDCVSLLQRAERLLQRHEDACAELIEVTYRRKYGKACGILYKRWY
ncbi:UNVERIFIED_CONTAM: hypothetical protein HHA_449390 [Hammondia hammondi]|eukprot:XP_008882074.1 hypothetical protein HHA_449390 [Hammondia hammondi]